MFGLVEWLLIRSVEPQVWTLDEASCYSEYVYFMGDPYNTALDNEITSNFQTEALELRQKENHRPENPCHTT